MWYCCIYILVIGRLGFWVAWVAFSLLLFWIFGSTDSEVFKSDWKIFQTPLFSAGESCATLLQSYWQCISISPNYLFLFLKAFFLFFVTRWKHTCHLSLPSSLWNSNAANAQSQWCTAQRVRLAITDFPFHSLPSSPTWYLQGACLNFLAAGTLGGSTGGLWSTLAAQICTLGEGWCSAGCGLI